VKALGPLSTAAQQLKGNVRAAEYSGPKPAQDW